MRKKTYYDERLAPFRFFCHFHIRILQLAHLESRKLVFNNHIKKMKVLIKSDIIMFIHNYIIMVILCY